MLHGPPKIVMFGVTQLGVSTAQLGVSIAQATGPGA